MAENNDSRQEAEISNSDPKNESLLIHPIVAAVQVFLSALSDIEECGVIYTKIAVDRKHEELSSIQEGLEGILDILSSSDSSILDRGSLVKKLLDMIRKISVVSNSNQANTMLKSFFLGVFSAYETFMSSLLAAIFIGKPDLFFKLGSTVPVVEVLKAPSIEDFKRTILENYLDSFRRQGYVEQFDALEKLFDGISLRKFDNWPSFVEISQRRNLVAHCNGVVSQQYLSVCGREGASVDDAKLGDTLMVSREYLVHACQVMREVSLKLTQTLWRKALPAELNEADSHLTGVGYEALQSEEWAWAEIVGRFAVGQKNLSSERTRLIFMVNLMIALKFSGKIDKLEALMASQDWSATAGEFKLAVAVLGDNIDEAVKLMHSLGDQFAKLSYHEWPLFREFRATDQFLSAV